MKYLCLAQLQSTHMNSHTFSSTCIVTAWPARRNSHFSPQQRHIPRPGASSNVTVLKSPRSTKGSSAMWINKSIELMNGWMDEENGTKHTWCKTSGTQWTRVKHVTHTLLKTHVLRSPHPTLSSSPAAGFFALPPSAALELMPWQPLGPAGLMGMGSEAAKLCRYRQAGPPACLFVPWSPHHAGSKLGTLKKNLWLFYLLDLSAACGDSLLKRRTFLNCVLWPGWSRLESLLKMQIVLQPCCLLLLVFIYYTLTWSNAFCTWNWPFQVLCVFGNLTAWYSKWAICLLNLIN